MTPLVLRGASIRGAPFSTNIDCVALSREAIEGVITCVQDFARNPLFTQKSFSENGVAMLKYTVDVADSVFVNEEVSPCSVFGDGCNQQVVSVFQSCQKKVVMRRKASRDTSERWFGAQSAGSPSTSASAGRSGVQISSFVEEAQVDHVAVPDPTVSSAHSVKSPVIGIKRKESVSSGPMSQNHSEKVSPVTSPRKSYVDDPSFGVAQIARLLGLVGGVSVIVGHFIFLIF